MSRGRGGNQIDTTAIRADADATYRELELCDEIDRLRRDLERSRQLHSNLLAHLRSNEGG